jgi:hypothetical protein
LPAADGYIPGMPSNETLWFAVLAVIILAVLAVLLIWITRGPGELPYYSREFLLSKGELAFFNVLRLAIPADVMIAPKVRLSDLIACSAEAWKAGFGGRISQKHVDFVLVDSTSTAILLVIELDDRSHRQAKRRERDIFVDAAFAAAGIPILHVTAASNYDARQLRKTIAGQLAASQEGS